MSKYQSHETVVFDLIKDKKPKIDTVLDIGINCNLRNPETSWVSRMLPDLGYNPKFTALEIYEPYIETGPKKYPNHEFVHGDVRNVDELFKDRSFDFVVWWHGPEHIPQEDIVSTLEKLKVITNEFLVLGSPEGWFAQGPDGGNHFDTHVSAPDTKLYKQCGFEAVALSAPHAVCAVAWKFFND